MQDNHRSWKPENFDEEVLKNFETILSGKINTPGSRKRHGFLRELIVTIRVNSEVVDGEVTDKNPDCGLLKYRQERLPKDATKEDKAKTKVWDPFAKRVVLGGQCYYTLQSYKSRGMGILKDTYKVLRLFAHVAKFPAHERQWVQEMITKKSMETRNFRCNRETMKKLMAIKNRHK